MKKELNLILTFRSTIGEYGNTYEINQELDDAIVKDNFLEFKRKLDIK